MAMPMTGDLNIAYSTVSRLSSVHKVFFRERIQISQKPSADSSAHQLKEEKLNQRNLKDYKY